MTNFYTVRVIIENAFWDNESANDIHSRALAPKGLEIPQNNSAKQQLNYTAQYSTVIALFCTQLYVNISALGLLLMSSALRLCPKFLELTVPDCPTSNA